MHKVGDVFFKDGMNYVVTEIENGFIDRGMPLRDWVCKTRMINVDDQMISLDEYIEMIEASILNSGSTKELLAGVEKPDKEELELETYTLTTGKKIVIQDSLTLVMKELMKIAKETGNIPEVKYSEDMRATEFRFEGYYCDFSLYLM